MERDPSVYSLTLLLEGEPKHSTNVPLHTVHIGGWELKSDYWNVSDEQVFEKTGKHLKAWLEILEAFDAKNRKSNEVVAFLQETHRVPRYWARTLTTRFLKQGE